MRRIQYHTLDNNSHNQKVLENYGLMANLNTKHQNKGYLVRVQFDGKGQWDGSHKRKENLQKGFVYKTKTFFENPQSLYQKHDICH